jgi:hypothetical protein
VDNCAFVRCDIETKEETKGKQRGKRVLGKLGRKGVNFKLVMLSTDQMKSSSVVNSGGDRYKVLETTNGKELSDTSYLEGLRINKKPTKKDISISTINIDGLFDNIDVSFNR